MRVTLVETMRVNNITPGVTIVTSIPRESQAHERHTSYIRVFRPRSGVRDIRPRSCEAAKRGIIINALNARYIGGREAAK